MSKDEALRLALEALEYPGPSWLEARQPAITAIKQALEQPVATNDTSKDRVDETAKQRHEPESVAWTDMAYARLGMVRDRMHADDVATVQRFLEGDYTSTPKREWQGLTDDERNDCLVEADPCECLATPEAEELMRCIEAKLKQKNGFAEEVNT